MLLLYVKFNAKFLAGNSSGAFIKASEDKSGILDFIERKIAKVTMIPRTYGEVCFFLNHFMTFHDSVKVM